MARTKKVVEAPKSRFTKPTVKSFDVIIRPVITEKTMKLMQEENKVKKRLKSPHKRQGGKNERSKNDQPCS